MKILRSKIFNFNLAALFFLIFFMGSISTAQAKEKQPRFTGLPEMTAEELAWQNKHLLKVKKIKLNRLGMKRINKWRRGKGKRAFRSNEVTLSVTGREMETALDENAVTDSSLSVPQADFPGSVDNSQLQYFPPIRSQGSLGSCGSFSGAYYTMTYMLAKAKGFDAKNGGDDFRLSPKWFYNMVNNGSDSGSWYYWAYEIGKKHGAATWSEFPYDANYRQWNTDPDVWLNALYRSFDQSGYIANTHTDAGIEQVKQMLLNGYVLNIPTYINSWNWKTISDDVSTTDDDAYVGKRAAFWVNGTNGYHAMTVVGYNDSIWVDINGNNSVDPGEKGAFRIANSWGTGWGEGGFCWMAYDALKQTSAVSGAPSQNRIYGWSPSRAHWVTAKSDYQPKLVARFSLNHLKRNHLRMTLGSSGIDETAPTSVWIPKAVYNQGGSYAFNGTTTAVDGGFVFDFTDLLNSQGGLTRYYLGLYDDTAGDIAVLNSFTLIDLENGFVETQCNQAPVSADNQQVYVYVDYASSDQNLPPEASFSVSDTSGQAPAVITFDGTSSFDQDGSVVSWDWDFGDGSSQSGSIVDHTYDNPGIFHAVLTVTDDKGATGSSGVDIEILADPNKTVHVSQIQMTLQTRRVRKRAQVMAMICDQDGIPVSGAQVTGRWSGLLTGENTAITADDGNSGFLSGWTKESGIITFTVTGVTLDGYTYAPDDNQISSESLPTEEIVNQNPVSVIQVTSDYGPQPLEVTFDGTGSYDSDGTIVAYHWDTGDGAVSDQAVFTHTYVEPGSFTATLTVTDDSGNTNTASFLIRVNSDQEILMHVSGISLIQKKRRSSSYVFAAVTVVDESGNPVPDVGVTARFTGLVAKDVSGITGADGSVNLISRRTGESGTVQFSVVNLSRSGYAYSPQDNVVTGGSIDIP